MIQLIAGAYNVHSNTQTDGSAPYLCGNHGRWPRWCADGSGRIGQEDPERPDAGSATSATAMFGRYGDPLVQRPYAWNSERHQMARIYYSGYQDESVTWSWHHVSCPVLQYCEQDIFLSALYLQKRGI